MTDIPEREGVSRAEFQAKILPGARPVVLRGLVSDWPVVRAARESAPALFAYLRRFDRGNSVPTMFAPPSAAGRFFFNQDLSGFNFQSSTAKLESAFSFLETYQDDQDASALAIQSVPVNSHLPGFQADNPMPLLDPSIEARVWLGNRVIVAAHHDPSENIACVVAGRRRFTLFPPEQLPNLYMGPFELTPAGATISMVDFDDPDLERHPRFAEAMEAAVVVDMEPGDALFIPYLWWHHVRSTEAVNMLVNYWWEPPSQQRGRPREALLHAMMALRALPPQHRDAWRVLFDHYVFGATGDPAAHLPADKRGILGEMAPASARQLRAELAKALSRPA